MTTARPQSPSPAGPAGTKLPQLKHQDKTEAGNYFVSNYPPFQYWSPAYIPAAMERFDTPSPPDTALGLYVHIPFCRKRCHFCYFKVYTDRNAKQIRRYTDAVTAELAMLAQRRFLDGRKPGFVYFGGGTPSYLSAEQLAHFTDGLKSVLPWDEAEEVTFECEPGTLTEGKLRAIREFGVTRLSLGIENFDDHILEINGRAHLSKQVYIAYEAARRVGFPQINIDLIAGMLEETDENWRRNIERTIALEPDSVTIYQMEIPFNTTIYKQMKAEGKLTAPVADWATKRRWVAEAFEALEAKGYTVGSAYTAVRDPKQKFIYRDRLWQGADLIGVGVASFGHIGGAHYQNEKNIDPYCDTVEAGRLPIFRAMVISDDERLIREMVLQFKLGRLSRAYFKDKFGVDIVERWKPVFDEYAADGYLAVEGDRIELSRQGLLRVDSLLPAFFLDEHRLAGPASGASGS